MKRTALSLALALPLMVAVAAPAYAAQDDVPPDLAESRLRGCLLAGASAAPTTGLAAAVAAVRSFCRPQIDRVQAYRVADATAGLSGDAAEAARKAAIRKLNDEIALAISNFTGLKTL